MTDTLFPIAADDIAMTSDECYTPRWVFDAMGLRFDLDVAAPPGGPWHVPADRWYTAADDGLTAPWEGLVWCNPPFSMYLRWAERFAAHPRAAILGAVQPLNRLLPTVFAAADAVSFIHCAFTNPGGAEVRLRQEIFVAFRGVGVAPAERLAAADPYGAVMYGPRGRR